MYPSTLCYYLCRRVIVVYKYMTINSLTVSCLQPIALDSEMDLKVKIGATCHPTRNSPRSLPPHKIHNSSQLHSIDRLIPSPLFSPELSCVCFPTASEKVYYDNLEQHSICDNKCKDCAQKNATSSCNLFFFNLTSVRQQSRNVKMYRIFDEDTTELNSTMTPCNCDERTNVLYRDIYCIPIAYLKEYSNYGQITISRTIKENLKALHFLCHTMKLRGECNYLANLCVLLEYSLDKESPCSIFYQARINDYTSESRLIKPNLFYKRGRNTIEDINKKLDQSYTVRRAADERPGLGLNFTILEFNFPGDLLKFGRSNLKFLNLCAMKNGYVEIFFPKNIHNRCQVSLEEMIEHHGGTTFNSIFIQYNDGKTRLLKRIPVLIRNHFQNQDTDSYKWQFVSRFYLVNTITGHRPGQFDNPYSERNMVKKFESVRYLRRVQLLFEVRDQNKVETPILMLHYDSVNLSLSTRNDFMYDFEFQVTFEKTMNFDTLLEILLPILFILGLIFAIVETIAYKIREGKHFVDMDVIIRFLIQLSSKIATTLFLTAISIAVYIHLVYKTQTTVKILLPDDIQQEIKYFLVVALFLRALFLAQHLYAMARIDIFFIDCERPKLGDNLLLAKNNNHLETPSSVGSRHINLESQHGSVSAWRNYFVANEWQELTTIRPISVFCHLFCVLILLHIVGMENFASNLFHFHLTRTEPNEMDSILQVSTGVLCFVASYLCQWLWNYLFWERYLKNPLQQFIDICCFANVSVFLFSQRCFGYYIHGRSPHGFADTDMCSMILQFKREEDNMCGNRGLLLGSENQTYRVLAPKNLRVLYDRLVLPILKPTYFNGNTTANGQQPHITDLDYSKKLNDRYQFERTLNTYQSINRFFMAFIDHVRR